jgi:diguanylate cyclase (GGDEF)-like protein/PAS domain S-box-containing protein
MPSPSEHETPDGPARVAFTPAAFIALGVFAAILTGLCAAAELSPLARGVGVALLVCALTATAVATRLRDQRALAKAAAIARRIMPGEPADAGDAAPALDVIENAVRILNSAAASLEAREARFSLLARAAGDTVWEWDLDTDMVACTHGGSAVLGRESDSFVEHLDWWQELVHPEDRQSVEDSVARIRRRETAIWSEEYRIRHADGSYRCVWDRGVAVPDETGRPAHIVGCMSDISARKRAEESLQRAEMRQRSLVTALASIVWREDLQSNTQPRNEQWEEFTGQSQEEEFGAGWLDAVHPDDRAHMLHAWSTAVRNESIYQSDLRLRRRDGAYRWMSARGAPVRDKSGKVVEFVGLYQDVNDYYEAREELARKSHQLRERIKELRCLHAIALVCNLDNKTVPEILSAVALVLPAALSRPELGVCSITWEGVEIQSPAYLPPLSTVSAPILVDGVELGRIDLGMSVRPGETDFLPEEQQMLGTAAKLVGQMVGRRSHRAQIEEQSQELWRRQAMFEQTERVAQIGGWEFDVAARSFTWSEGARRLAGQGGAAAAAGSDHPAGALLQRPIYESLKTGEPFDLELPWDLPGEDRKWLHVVGQVQEIDGRPERVVGMLKDITQQKQDQSRVWHLAHHDPLTDLPNRRYFQQRLESSLGPEKSTTALVLIDLDHFKEVNDTLGHDVGDALLRAVAERLRQAAAGRAMVARLGGDEFAVVAPTADRVRAIEFAESLLRQLREPITFAGQTTQVRFSAGMAVAPLDGSTATEILKSADIALYFGKMRGRGTFVPYAPKMRDGMERRLSVCTEVRQALDDDQIEPFYQPKISLGTGRLAGFEALLRWRHPDGIRTPGSLAPAFEDQEIATALFKRMLDRAVADMASWRDADLDYVQVALNTSAAEYTNLGLAEHILSCLASAQLPASSLAVEVTETVLLGRDAGAVGRVLQTLSDSGIGIALDDFGTGYASLTHLQQFPVDVIKIDQSFIRCLETDSGCQAITSAVLGLGRNLGITVVAEGVETLTQAELLRVAGCDQAQGYFYAEPLPASAVPSFIRNWSGLAQESARPRSLSAA